MNRRTTMALTAGGIVSSRETKLHHVGIVAPELEQVSILMGLLGLETAHTLDVLEHIEDDRMELEPRRPAAQARRASGGARASPPVSVQSSSTGRSATSAATLRRMLRDLRPAGLEFIAAWYLDSAGLLASLGNRLFLRQGMPTPEAESPSGTVCSCGPLSCSTR